MEVQKNNEVLTFKGNRDAWLGFTYQVRRNRKKVWEALEPLLNKYMIESRTTKFIKTR
jgi:hypothetical protein